jgi:hypothetical protein
LRWESHYLPSSLSLLSSYDYRAELHQPFFFSLNSDAVPSWNCLSELPYLISVANVFLCTLCLSTQYTNKQYIFYFCLSFFLLTTM